MLISDISSIVSYVYTGVDTFPVPFSFYGLTTVKVGYRADSDPTSASPYVPLVYEIDYTVTGVKGNENDGDQAFKSGSVTLTSVGAAKVPSNGIVVVMRETPLEQQFAYNELDNFPAKSHENGLGRQAVISQEITAKLSRVLMVPPGADANGQDLLQTTLSTMFVARDAAQAAEAAAGHSAVNASASASTAANEANRAEHAVAAGLTDIEQARTSAVQEINEARDSSVTTVQAEGAAQVLRAHAEADRAKAEADRAKAEADRASAVVGIDIATRTRLGIVKIGRGLDVSADGTVSGASIMSAPVISMPTEVSNLWPTQVSFNKPTVMLPGTQISSYEVTITRTMSGTTNASLTPDGSGRADYEFQAVGSPGEICTVTAYATDSLGNYSKESSADATITTAFVDAPSIVSPTSGTTLERVPFTVTSTPFNTVGASDTHASTDWKVTTDAEGLNVVQSAMGSSDLTSHTFSAIIVAIDTPMYVWVRYNGSVLGSSGWAYIYVMATPSVTETVITASGTYTAPYTGVYSVTVIGGGGGGGWRGGSSPTFSGNTATYFGGGGGGGAGGTVTKNVYLTAGEQVPVVVGAGGIGAVSTTLPPGGGSTSFGTSGTAAYVTVIGGSPGGHASGTTPGSGGTSGPNAKTAANRGGYGGTADCTKTPTLTVRGYGGIGGTSQREGYGSGGTGSAATGAKCILGGAYTGESSSPASPGTSGGIFIKFNAGG